MERKRFVQKSFIGLFAGFLAATGGKSKASSDEKAAEDTNKPFRFAWIRSLVGQMDARLEEGQKNTLMESCGRECAKRGAVKMAEAFKGNMDGMLAELEKHLGKDHAVREGDHAFLEYDQCYCPMVAGMEEKLSGTWCQCSRGWVLEMFGIAAGKQVRVELLQSIMKGDPVCRFRIDLA
ncbi:hypothetical protein JW906_03275 [bacterium]|nr:hypothetical protein [bacterium]